MHLCDLESIAFFPFGSVFASGAVFSLTLADNRIKNSKVRGRKIEKVYSYEIY